ncbi:uncharacterized protein B0I36DRAFT_155680 [Microdochium trichocladiopsis]|uniref:Uncharacterized protein n=1 Tax=Microdochium trichocladiopsis TaxID=1682393 RepID=A0A9P8Y1B2_9PEZI|nr:uncharacterized protein B0I36DRAFT_155680 [Microdochium trichocladiopsis]KAH7026236.1 hypothetical protein B0I36DRAFT_155680 [Microdochium trichocladiopsis]
MSGTDSSSMLLPKTSYTSPCAARLYIPPRPCKDRREEDRLPPWSSNYRLPLPTLQAWLLRECIFGGSRASPSSLDRTYARDGTPGDHTSFSRAPAQNGTLQPTLAAGPAGQYLSEQPDQARPGVPSPTSDCGRMLRAERRQTECGSAQDPLAMDGVSVADADGGPPFSAAAAPGAADRACQLEARLGPGHMGEIATGRGES